jgi:hypothetical protein
MLAPDIRERVPYPELFDERCFRGRLSALRCFEESRFVRFCDLISFDEVDAERGLGGRLVTRVEAAWGGSGKVPMLDVLRIVLGNAEGVPGELGLPE